MSFNNNNDILNFNEDLKGTLITRPPIKGLLSCTNGSSTITGIDTVAFAVNNTVYNAIGYKESTSPVSFTILDLLNDNVYWYRCAVTNTTTLAISSWYLNGVLQAGTTFTLTTGLYKVYCGVLRLPSANGISLESNILDEAAYINTGLTFLNGTQYTPSISFGANNRISSSSISNNITIGNNCFIGGNINSTENLIINTFASSAKIGVTSTNTLSTGTNSNNILIANDFSRIDGGFNTIFGNGIIDGDSNSILSVYGGGYITGSYNNIIGAGFITGSYNNLFGGGTIIGSYNNVTTTGDCTINSNYNNITYTGDTLGSLTVNQSSNIINFTNIAGDIVTIPSSYNVILSYELAFQPTSTIDNRNIMLGRPILYGTSGTANNNIMIGQTTIGTTSGTKNNNSVAIGTDIVITGNYATAIGGQNIKSSGNYSVTMGQGFDNTNRLETSGANSFTFSLRTVSTAGLGVNAGDMAIMLGGYNHSITSTGDSSGIFAGEINTISGVASATLGGALNNISSQYAAIIGGSNHTLSGNRSVILGGNAITLTEADTVYLGGIKRGGYVYSFTWTTSVSNNSNTSYTNLASFTGVTGAIYVLRMIGNFQTAATTTGIKLRLSGTATCNVAGKIYAAAQANASAGELVTTAANMSSELISTGVSAINTPHQMGAEIIFRCTTGGTIIMQFASEINASNVTVNIGTSIFVERIN